MTYKQAAQSALDVQSACNLSGVIFSFAEAMHAICDEANRLNEGTEWKNRNPIVTLYLTQILWLNGRALTPESIDYSAAHNACEKIARE